MFLSPYFALKMLGLETLPEKIHNEQGLIFKFRE